MMAVAQPYTERGPLGILGAGSNAISVVALCVTLLGQRAAHMAAGPLLLPAAEAK